MIGDFTEVNASDMSNAVDNIGSEVDAMDQAQEDILKRSHQVSSKEVRDAIKLSDKTTLAQKGKNE